jgi:hypothetical protein
MQLIGYFKIFGLYLLIIHFFYYQSFRISVYVYLVFRFPVLLSLYGQLIDFVEYCFYMYILVEDITICHLCLLGKFCMSLVLITVVIKTSNIPHLLDSKWGYRTCIVE